MPAGDLQIQNGGAGHSLLASVAVLGCCLALGEAGNLRVSRELQGGTVTCNPKEFEGEGFTGCKVLDEENLALHWKADDDGKSLSTLHSEGQNRIAAEPSTRLYIA